MLGPGLVEKPLGLPVLGPGAPTVVLPSLGAFRFLAGGTAGVPWAALGIVPGAGWYIVLGFTVDGTYGWCGVPSSSKLHPCCGVCDAVIDGGNGACVGWGAMGPGVKG